MSSLEFSILFCLLHISLMFQFYSDSPFHLSIFDKRSLFTVFFFFRSPFHDDYHSPFILNLTICPVDVHFSDVPYFPGCLLLLFVPISIFSPFLRYQVSSFQLFAEYYSSLYSFKRILQYTGGEKDRLQE